MGKSLRRLTRSSNGPAGYGDWDRTKASLYGLGTDRPVDLFYKLALVDVAGSAAFCASSSTAATCTGCCTMLIYAPTAAASIIPGPLAN